MKCWIDAGRPLMVYNTPARDKEEFVPLEAGKVAMYNCGPTVYDYFHVGNARNFVCADVIRRYLAARGYDVTFVQNITDIDDKIIQRAQEEGREAADVAEEFTEVFLGASAKLGVRPADHHPRATEYVGKMVGLIRKLEQGGYAYEAEGDVYFRVARFETYGKLSGRRSEDLVEGARVEVSKKKEAASDFTLWKAAKEGEPSWPSPWGPGRPGWHTECSVMSRDILGDTIDVHMGGNDLIFPHHENEIAQSEAATGKGFVRYWLHNGFLNVDGEKMSKSFGNFFTIDEVLARFEAPVVRYFLLSAHYRGPLDFSDAALSEAAVALDRLREARKTARRLTASIEAEFEADRRPPEPLATVCEAFQAAMDDDFNTPRALAVLFDCATRINQLGNRELEAEKSGGALDPDDVRRVALLALALDELGGEVLGLEFDAPHADIQHLRGDLRELLEEIGKEAAAAGGLTEQSASAENGGAAGEARTEELIENLIALRAAARKGKQWALADRIRDGLHDLGFDLLDRPSGTEWKKH